MAENSPVEYNWDQVDGQAALRLKAVASEHVPAGVVKQAQRSRDGVHYHLEGKPQFNEDGSPLMTHNLRYKFPDEATAQAFAVLIKKAGKHITPRGSVQAVIDPDRPRGRSVTSEPVDPTVVAWQAYDTPGRKAQV
jgi:hypothetical protein